MLPVKIHPDAVDEAVEALRWYYDKSEDVALLFLRELETAIDKIRRSPDSWLQYQFGTKRFLVHRFPFAVIYRVKDSSIEILAIAHLRRKPFYWKKRKRL